jgi:hypothetical protein
MPFTYRKNLMDIRSENANAFILPTIDKLIAISCGEYSAEDQPP